MIDKHTFEDLLVWEWGLDYVAAGQKHAIDGEDDCNSHSRRLYWQIKGWRSSPSVWDLCRRIGSEQHGANMDEVFIRTIGVDIYQCHFLLSGV
jgi:hypothetical protein